MRFSHYLVSFSYFLMFFFVLFAPSGSVFAIDSPVLSFFILRGETGYICSGDSMGCSSLNSLYFIDEDYICSGGSLSCSSLNALYKIKRSTSDIYICSGNSIGCSSLSALYKIRESSTDTYICSGNSIGCSSLSALYKIRESSTDTYICSGDSIGCSSLSALYKFKKDVGGSNFYSYSDNLICPENSYSYNNNCYCNAGYYSTGSSCITNKEKCEMDYGKNVYGEINTDGALFCYCEDGYMWNDGKTACIKKDPCLDMINGYFGDDGNCYCNIGYIWDNINSRCIINPENVTVDKNLENFIVEEKRKISYIDKNLSNKLSGRIILQVEANGEAWYLNPENNKRYFLGRPEDAFNVMRELGLGISNKDFETLNGVAPRRLSGKILLKVEDSGEAYYVNPIDLKMHFLGRPSDAFEVMRNLGLGISNSDIIKIDIN